MEQGDQHLERTSEGGQASGRGAGEGTQFTTDGVHPPEGFKLAWWAGLPLVGFVGLLAASVVSIPNSPYVAVDLIARFLTVLIVASGFAAIGYFASRRSNRVGNVMFCAGVLLASFGQMHLMSKRTEKREQAIATMRAFDEQLKGRQLEQVKRGEQIDAGAGFRERTEQLEKAAANLDARTQAVTKEMIAILSEAREANVATEQAAEKLVQLGGCDPNTFATKQDVADRIALVDRLLEADQTRKATVQHTFLLGRRRLVAAGASQEEAIAIVARWDRDMKSIAAVQQKQREFTNVMRTVLVLLHDRWGDWAWQEQKQIVEFGDVKLLSEWEGLMKKLQTLGVEQARLKEASIKALDAAS